MLVTKIILVTKSSAEFGAMTITGQWMALNCLVTNRH